MTDLFDLANLITTVGVDGVKIKSEPGLPEKSSNEILTELFNTFDAADDGVASPENSDQQVPNGNTKSAKLDKLQAKKKKKKHKHKEKKHKKRSRHNSSDSNSDVEGNDNACMYHSELYITVIVYFCLLIRREEKEET